MAEHRVYLASCGFFMASAALASWLTGADAGLTRARSRWLAGGVAVVLSVFLALTVARNRVWADPVRLWEDAASKAPEVFAAQAGLGYVQWVAGNCDAAETAYERAMNLRPSEPEPYIVMADCLLGHRRLFDAYTLLRLGVVRAPQDIQIRLMLAPLEERRFGGSAEALRLCREALNLKPDSVAAQACIQRNIDK
jgi:predicted Zn-dependent protease